MSNDNKNGKLSFREIALKGLVIAVIVTIPSISAFMVSWYLLDSMLQAAIIGAVVHFIAMGFSLKISKKILVKS